MESLKLKGAFSSNPRIQPLLEGAVPIPGIEVQWELGRSPELHLVHLRDNVFDVFEFSLSNYMMTRDCPDERERLQWTALPIFLTKAFNLFDRLYVRRDSGVAGPADLRGRRMGVPDYHMTAAVWMRIVLKELYGILPEEIDWFNFRPPGVSHGSGAGEALASGIHLTRAKRDGELEERLRRGEFDAVCGDSVTRETFSREGSLRLLFGPGEVARVMADFRRKTGVTPVNHVVIVQRHLADRHREAADRLYRAFETSKLEAYKRARQSAPGYLLFAGEAFARQAALFGEDPFPSGLAANRKMLETLAGESFAEGLIGKMPDIDGLFCESMLTT